MAVINDLLETWFGLNGDSGPVVKIVLGRRRDIGAATEEELRAWLAAVEEARGKLDTLETQIRRALDAGGSSFDLCGEQNWRASNLTRLRLLVTLDPVRCFPRAAPDILEVLQSLWRT